MRILVVTPFPPHPHGQHGGSVYLGTYIEELARQSEVALVCLASPAEAAAATDLPAGLARTELVAHASVRDLRGARRLGHWARMLGSWGPGRWPLLVAKHRSPDLARKLAEVAGAFEPDIAVFEMAVMAQYLEVLPDCPKVLTDHERGDPKPNAIGPKGLGARRDHRLWENYVRELYRHAALVQTLNAEDAEHLGALLRRTVEVRPTVVPIPERRVEPARSGPRVLFLGNFLHTPNAEACLRLAVEVWPLVLARQPEAQLWLVGREMPEAVRALSARPGVRVYGAIDDLQALFGEVRMLLAPLYSGAGTRIKVLTAMAHGLPVVSNRLGLRGINPPPGAVACHESNEELAAAVTAWLRDAEGAGAAGARARRWIEAAASPASVVSEEIARFQRLLAR